MLSLGVWCAPVLHRSTSDVRFSERAVAGTKGNDNFDVEATTCCRSWDCAQ